MLAQLCPQPRRAKLGCALHSRHASVGKILLQSASKCVGVDRVAMKKSAEEHDLRRKQMKPGRDCLCVFAQNLGAVFYNFCHARIAPSCGFKNDRREHRDLHFVRCLGPANNFIKIIQRKCMQDFRRELHLAAVQIVFMQEEAQRLNGKKITAACVAEDVSPTTRVLDFVTPSPRNRGATSSVDHYSVPISEGSRKARFTIAASEDSDLWPDFGAEDRKSTRLNSSHVEISYAVFCLKKKKHDNC